MYGWKGCSRMAGHHPFAELRAGIATDPARAERLAAAKRQIAEEQSAYDEAVAAVERARWRADERRWVRQGVLPRCGWMGEAVPESPRWTERAPERAAEATKLARKRAEALARMGAER